MVEAMPDFGADFAPEEKLAGIVGRLTIYQYLKTKYADTAKADERVSLFFFDWGKVEKDTGNGLIKASGRI